MSLYRILIDTPQRDGSSVPEIQHVEVPQGAEPPEGAVLVPADFDGVPYSFDETAGAYVVDLDACRVAKWAAVKVKRDELETGVAQTPVGPVQIDERSKAKVHALATMAMLAQQAGAPFAEPFTMADNSVRVLSASDAVAMALAAGRFVADVHAVARELRGQIAAAQTLEAIATIDVEAAPWPASGHSGGGS